MDRRLKKTESAFENALFHFLQEKELRKISVKEICEYANMNRGTFYLHYEDIYDLMDKAEQSMVDNLFRQGLSLTKGQNDIFAAYDYIKNHKDVYKALVINPNSPGFTKKFTEKIRSILREKAKEQMPDINEEMLENALVFYVGGSISILYNWVINDCKNSLQEMLDSAELISKLQITFNKRQ